MHPAEQIDTSLKKGRGMAQRSLGLIEAMRAAAEVAQPITGRGVGYKLFTAGLRRYGFRVIDAREILDRPDDPRP
jgi:hypothetical protein